MEWNDRGLKYRLNECFDLSEVPKRPGVYIFIGRGGDPLYVGKAKVLRHRIASYLRQGAVHAPKTSVMLKKARLLDIIVTGSEKEALILEAELIGDLKPRYNIRLRDNKAYPFLRIGTGSLFPRLGIVRKRCRDRALYFGPYTSAVELRRTLNLISSLFRPRTCSDASMKNRSRACLRYQVGKCSAPCVGMVSKEEYQASIDRIRAFLNGRTRRVIRELEAEMRQAASNLDFERAAVLRDSIKAIEGVIETQSVIAPKGIELDVVAIEHRDAAALATILKVREGVLCDKLAFGLKTGLEEDIGQVYFDFVRLFYAKAEVPGEVIVPDLLEESQLAELSSFLTQVRGKRAAVRVGVRGIRKRLLETAMINAKQRLGRELSREEDWKRLSRRLQEIFSLKVPPDHVEGVDISNTSGRESVGSIVCFMEGMPDKAFYRQFNMDVGGPNDYAMIKEVVSKRVKRGVKNGDLPHLMIIDGGRGQLSMAIDAATELGVIGKLDIISIAKEHGPGGEKIYLAGRGKPLRLERNSEVLRFCQRVRDEAHRFGLRCHRRKRTRKSISSVLSSIPGVGSKRRALLLNHFGSVRAIASASIEELRSVPGLPTSVAIKIHDFFRKEVTKKCQG